MHVVLTLGNSLELNKFQHNGANQIQKIKPTISLHSILLISKLCPCFSRVDVRHTNFATNNALQGNKARCKRNNFKVVHPVNFKTSETTIFWVAGDHSLGFMWHQNFPITQQPYRPIQFPAPHNVCPWIPYNKTFSPRILHTILLHHPYIKTVTQRIVKKVEASS